MAGARIGAADRTFFEALADVVFGNPFSTERAALVVRLAPGAKPGDLTQDREALARLVAPRLAPWLGKTVDERDRRTLEPALLYVSYHRCVPQLDAHIERQARQSGAPLKVTFADEAIADLVGSGFSEDEAARYFSLFYQLRRGCYFI